LDARVNRAKVRAQQAFLFIMVAQEWASNLQEAGVGGRAGGGLAERSQFKLKILN
jgi:hypothetical protein